MTFKPDEHLMKLKGSDYLPAVWRVVWFREEHPDGQIDTEVVFWDHERQEIMVRAVVVAPKTGARATAHCVCSLAEFKNGYAEKAETQAVGRALALLGYGTAFAGQDLDEGDRPAEAPLSVSRNGSSSDQAKDLATATSPAPSGPVPGPKTAVVHTLAGGLGVTTASEQLPKGPDGQPLGDRARALLAEIRAAQSYGDLHGANGLAGRVSAAKKSGDLRDAESAALFDAINKKNQALRASPHAG